MYPVVLANFYKFFKEKNALSPETAITLTKEEFLELGLPGGFGWYFGIPYMSPINKTKESKYWFSVKYYENNNRNTIIISLITVAIVVVVAFVFTLLIWLIAGLPF